jgi:2,3-bisphosphoglycerate-dependent phosphoglycerate mutase
MKDCCEIYIVRHGETDWNAEGLLQGHSDIPLNEIGILQAHQLKEKMNHVPFVAAFSSDLCRAKKTAQILLEPRSLSILETPALRERYAGPFEGKQVSELDRWMQQHASIIPSLSREEYFQYQWHPQMETYHSVYQRFRLFLDQQANIYLGSAILVVTHGGVIRSLLDYLEYKPGNKRIISNCGFIQIRANTENFSLEKAHGVSWKAIF